MKRYIGSIVRNSTPSRATAKDVARLAGVSLGTVSRVTSGNPTVAAAVRDRVLAAVAALNYRPNAAAQSMRTAASKLIGCLVADIANPLYAAILRAAEAPLSAAGYSLLIASTGGSLARELALIEAFAGRRIDGLMGVFSDERDPLLLRALQGIGLPILLLERSMAVPGDSIATDHLHGMRDATEALLALGHRRIALITGSQATRSGRERVGGYLAAFAAAGLTADPALLRTESLTTGYALAETQALMGLPAAPTAIISGGNQMLAGVLQGLALTGRRIPADVSVISSGDTELAAFAAPPVTVSRWDLEAFGHTAAALLTSRIRDPDRAPRHVVAATELVLRKSCAPPAVR